MFYGDEQLYFKPEEAELIAEAEGHPHRRRRHAPAARPHHPDGVGPAMFLGLLLAVSLAIGLVESRKASNADAGAVESQPVRPLAPHSRPQIDARPKPSQAETPATSLPPNSSAPAGAQLAPVQNLLPPGWERIATGANSFPLLDEGAYSLHDGVLPAGTNALVRRWNGCWHIAISEDGRKMGQICITWGGPREPAREIPPRWAYERLNDKDMLVRRLPNNLIVYILADGSGQGWLFSVN